VTGLLEAARTTTATGGESLGPAWIGLLGVLVGAVIAGGAAVIQTRIAAKGAARTEAARIDFDRAQARRAVQLEVLTGLQTAMGEHVYSVTHFFSANVDRGRAPTFDELIASPFETTQLRFSVLAARVQDDDLRDALRTMGAKLAEGVLWRNGHDPAQMALNEALEMSNPIAERISALILDLI
jgi:hypothetical protein